MIRMQTGSWGMPVYLTIPVHKMRKASNKFGTMIQEGIFIYSQFCNLYEYPYAFFIRPVTPLYEGKYHRKKTENGWITSRIDEEVYGNICRILLDEGDWLKVRTHYGYIGYVERKNVSLISRSEMEQYFQKYLMITKPMWLDILSFPSVQGTCMITLPSGSVIEVLYSGPECGWSRVKLRDGSCGFVKNSQLEPWLCGNEYLIEKDTKVPFSFEEFLSLYYGGDADHFRKKLIENACFYLGMQYRWGGRSSFGMDCSGLVHTAYRKAGISIYRDAKLEEDYPVKRISPQLYSGEQCEKDCRNGGLLLGDLLYFPGHVAMYVGNGEYIHSTAGNGCSGVVINSLYEESRYYRRDLYETLYAAGRVC